MLMLFICYFSYYGAVPSPGWRFFDSESKNQGSQDFTTNFEEMKE